MRRLILGLLASVTVALFCVSCEQQIETVKPKPPTGISKGIYGVNWSLSSCLPASNDEKLDIMTLNLWNFPVYRGNVPWNESKIDTTRTNHVADMILKTKMDVIALQEVSYSDEMDRLIAKMPGWKYKARWSRFFRKQALVFLYNSEAVDLVDFAIVPDNSFANFTSDRNPLVAKFRYKTTGKEYTLVNLHFKALSSGYRQRVAEAKALKKYVDENLADESVIILGDWNDTLDRNTFDDFYNDRDYRFADLNIANGSKDKWSYKGYSRTSHIDHILVSDELFGKTTDAFTATYDCVGYTYYDKVSDHRGVGFSVK